MIVVTLKSIVSINTLSVLFRVAYRGRPDACEPALDFTDWRHKPSGSMINHGDVAVENWIYAYSYISSVSSPGLTGIERSVRFSIENIYSEFSMYLVWPQTLSKCGVKFVASKRVFREAASTRVLLFDRAASSYLLEVQVATMQSFGFLSFFVLFFI